MKRVTIWATALVLATSVSLFGGAPAAQSSEKRADQAHAMVTPEALRDAPGQNKMVWVSTPKANRLPVIDGTLRLEQGEWSDAAAVYGMLAPRPALLLPMHALTFLTWDEDHLYLGMRTEVKPGYVLRRRIRDMDAGVARDDSIELVFNPLGRDQPEQAMFQIMYNALGARWDAMVTVGVTAKYWDAEGWEFKSDYKPGMDHWDLEIKIPVKSMRIKGRNESGQCWLVLPTRDWKWLVDEQGKLQWNIYSSITGNGGFISQENQFPLVLDSAAPVVQLLDLGGLCNGQFALKARFANTSAQPQTFTAVASVYDNTAFQGRDQDWTLRDNPLVSQNRAFTLKPGESAEWVIPASALPELKVDPVKKLAAVYGFVFKVSRPGSALPLFVRQCDFTRQAYTGKQDTPGYPMDIAYNPVRSTIMPSCDVIDFPDKERLQGLAVEIYPAGEKPQGKPLFSKLVTRTSKNVITELLSVPALKPGSYPVRLVLIDKQGKAIETKEDLALKKLDEAKEFPWWDSRAGISDRPMPPHQAMRYEPSAVLTATGKVTFAGSALPAQVHMTGKDLLAAPVRLTASAGGTRMALAADAAARFGRKTDIEAELTGAVRCGAFQIKVDNHMEYDGAQWITLNIEPAAAEVNLDYLRLELPFKPEQGQWLFTMAMAGRESWVAEDLTRGEGKIWDSAKCRGLGMTVGTFMPQYVVSDSLRGLCWYADNDRGWVPTNDVPATEVLRQGGETILRLNLIGKPFTMKGPRQIQFGLLGLPARPMPKGGRIVDRRASQFGHYVGDKVMNYSPPMPRDFAKARDFMEKGTLYDKKTFEPVPRAVAKEWLMEFAPWHDSHNPWKTPDLHPDTYTYLAKEFDDYGFVPRLRNLRSWQWERYVKATPIVGIYYDTPEGMGFSRSIQNGVAYVIPDDQPGAGSIQAGYNLTGFREQIKRVYTILHQNGVDNPWVEMHSTHGPCVPATGFLTMRIDGEDFRRPSYRNFMAAWPVRHLRAIDVPALFGSTTRWLGGYPWDNQTRNVDPLRCQIAALLVHDVWTPGFGSWSSNTISGKGVLISKCDRQPPYGFKNPRMSAKLIGLGMNRDETRFLPYWDNAGALTLTLDDGRPAEEVRASAWLVPSQNRLIVVASNWNARTVACRLKFTLGNLGLATGADEEILMTDLETDKVLARGRTAPKLDFRVEPLDFRMFMVTAATLRGPAVAPRAGGGGYGLNRPGAPAAASAVASPELAAKLAALGINRGDARFIAEGDRDVALLGSDGKGAGVVRAGAWLIPSQKRLIVAVGNPAEKPVSAKLKVDLRQLGLMPAHHGENIIISDLEEDNVLLQSTGMNRGQLLGLWKGLRGPTGEKIASPADEVGITVPGQACKFFMVTTQ